MPPPSIITVPILSDNYAYIISAPDAVVVIDPGEAGPVLRALKDRSLTPTHILITHYDYDHVAGLGPVVAEYGPRVIGPGPAGVDVDEVCSDREPVPCGGVSFRVINTPGHADPHVSFYVEERGWLFSGDCLFGSGCGRVRGGAYRTMYDSLEKLSGLPDDTRVYFGHEYTLDNLAFAASVEPGNEHTSAYREKVEALLRKGGHSSPSLLADEKRTNPFLRTSSSEIREAFGSGDTSGEDVFTALRRAKDSFAG